MMSLPDTLETRRVLLRPFTLADAETAHTWLSDPVVMKYAATGPDGSVEHTRARLARYHDHQTRHGFSKWLIVDRATSDGIGDAGLLVTETNGEAWIDLGYRLALPYWGAGLATEVASVWVQTAFTNLRLLCLSALVHPENHASIRVVQKLGFRAERQDLFWGKRAIYFTMTVDDFQPRRAL